MGNYCKSYHRGSYLVESLSPKGRFGMREIRECSYCGEIFIQEVDGLYEKRTNLKMGINEFSEKKRENEYGFIL